MNLKFAGMCFIIVVELSELRHYTVTLVPKFGDFSSRPIKAECYPQRHEYFTRHRRNILEFLFTAHMTLKTISPNFPPSLHDCLLKATQKPHDSINILGVRFFLGILLYLGVLKKTLKTFRVTLWMHRPLENFKH